jgi:crotonobetainyl-CoA:carnitine CoA-transferase CaiB-like acyl-CoA transferase
MGWAVTNYLVGGVAPQPTGNQNPTAAPSGTFHAADGPLNIAANRQEHFEKLCRCLGRPDLLADPRFVDREQRKRHRDELNRQIDAALTSRSALAWERELNLLGVPAARILTVPQVVETEQLAHRGFLTRVPFPGEGATADGRQVRVTGTGVLFDGQPQHPTAPAPLLGEHNDELPLIAQRWRASRGFGNDGTGSKGGPELRDRATT